MFLFLAWACHLYANWTDRDVTNKYLVVVPICKAPTKPITIVDQFESTQDLYNELPSAPESELPSCYRANQLLFNEVVEVLAATEDKYIFNVQNAFYEDGSHIKQIIFCTLKEHLVSIHQLQELGIDLSAIPEFNPTDLSNQLVLQQPWQDSITGYLFSAGTRFVRDREDDSMNTYAVKLITCKHNTYSPITIVIPKELCITKFAHTHEEKKFT